MKNILKITVLLAVLLASIQANACWFEDPPPPCPYCGGSQHTVTFIECPTCGTTYASCTSHKCDDSECPGCREKGVIHGLIPYHCCGETSRMYVCQPRLTITCGCGASYANPSHALATCPDCGQKYHVCVGHVCTVNPEDPIPPVDDPPDTPYDPPQPGDPDYPYPVDPGDPPFYNPDPPIVILPPADPGDPPIIVPVPPEITPPTNPSDPPVYIPPDDPGDPPIVILPPADPGDPPIVVPIPPGITPPTNPGDPPVYIPPDDSGDPPIVILPPADPGDPPIVITQPPEIGPENPDPENEDIIIQRMVYSGNESSVSANQVKTTVYYVVETEIRRTVDWEIISETVISTDSWFWRECLICGKEGAWDLPICPDADLTCPDCGENIHGVFDHECAGVPEDPTVEDPGEDPPEAGDPDPTPQPEVARFYFSRLNQQAITKPVGTTYTVDLPMSVYSASTTGSPPGDMTIYLHCVPDEVTSGATYIPAVTSATLKSFIPPAPPLQLFGRNLYPNMTSSKSDDTWHSDDEFLLILSTDPDTADVLTEVDNCCDGAGCRYHLRVKFREGVKPGR